MATLAGCQLGLSIHVVAWWSSCVDNFVEFLSSSVFLVYDDTRSLLSSHFRNVSMQSCRLKQDVP